MSSHITISHPDHGGPGYQTTHTDDMLAETRRVLGEPAATCGPYEIRTGPLGYRWEVYVRPDNTFILETYSRDDRLVHLRLRAEKESKVFSDLEALVAELEPEVEHIGLIA